LFIGKTDTDKWVGTSVKINPHALAGAKGLRVGIVPVRQGQSDLPKDDVRNIVVCPLLHDGNFMEVFYAGWGIVQQFIAADARVPKEVALPPPEREVARQLANRREFPVRDVVAALAPLAQPELLVTDTRQALMIFTRGESTTAGAVIAPQAARRWLVLSGRTKLSHVRGRRGGRGVGGVERVREGVPEPRQKVPVAIESHRDRLVAEALLDRLRMRTRADQQRRACVNVGRGNGCPPSPPGGNRGRRASP
jgi:hypothetical protein